MDTIDQQIEILNLLKQGKTIQYKRQGIGTQVWADLLRTSSYTLRDKITEGGELRQLYTRLYANLANVVPAASVQKVKAQFTF